MGCPGTAAGVASRAAVGGRVELVAGRRDCLDNGRNRGGGPSLPVASLRIAALLLAVAPSVAVAADDVPLPREVVCGNAPCGTMAFSRYRKFADGDGFPAYERNGVAIAGRFQAVPGRNREYHYLQVLTEFIDDDVRWTRDRSVPLPRRHVDAPPFGQWALEVTRRGLFRDRGLRQDALPWYDAAGEFPDFEDLPREFLAVARRRGLVRMHFETWLVCVIRAEAGPDPDRVGDDAYEVAPLAGWTWGYDLVHAEGAEPGRDSFGDYTFGMLPLVFVDAPSAAYREGLDAVYGAGVQDRFRITLGSSDRCRDPASDGPRPSAARLP